MGTTIHPLSRARNRRLCHDTAPLGILGMAQSSLFSDNTKAGVDQSGYKPHAATNGTFGRDETGRWGHPTDPGQLSLSWG